MIEKIEKKNKNKVVNYPLFLFFPTLPTVRISLKFKILLALTDPGLTTKDPADPHWFVVVVLP